MRLHTMSVIMSWLELYPCAALVLRAAGNCPS